MAFNLPSFKINVDFIANTYSIEPGNQVQFTTNLSGSLNFYWTFGNGQTSTQSQATITYPSAGTYSVSLMAASENAGGYKLKNDLISVILPPPPPYISDFATFSGSYAFSGEGPFATATSWYFTGGNGKLDPTTDIDIAADEDFTVEMFVKQTTDVVYTRLMSIGSHPSTFAFYLSANDGDIFYLSYNNQFYPFSVQSNYLNNWRHYAVVRKNNVIKLYVDGVADAVTYNISASLTTGSEFITIPSLPDGNNGAQGYFSNFRWTKSAVYDGNFTPPSTNLEPLPQTKVLLVGPPDPDISNFLTAIDETPSSTIGQAITDLVVGLKTYNIWSKMKAIYPFVGGTADKHKYNLKDARDLDASFRLVFNGGWTHTSTGALPNGTNGFADTKLLPSSQLSQDSVHLSYYSRTDVRNKTCIDIGVDTDPAFYINYNYNGFNFKGLNRSQSLVGSLFNPTTGLLIGNRPDSTTEKYYHKGTLIDTLSENSSGLPTQNIYIGAIWSRFFSGAGEFSNRETAWASIGSGLTDTDASNLYTLVEDFQTTLGRNV